MADSPIGTLLLDAEAKAKKKANGHTSEAPCGCRVSAHWFSEHSRTNTFEPCPEHAPKRDAKGRKV